MKAALSHIFLGAAFGGVQAYSALLIESNTDIALNFSTSVGALALIGTFVAGFVAYANLAKIPVIRNNRDSLGFFVSLPFFLAGAMAIDIPLYLSAEAGNLPLVTLTPGE